MASAPRLSSPPADFAPALAVSKNASFAPPPATHSLQVSGILSRLKNLTVVSQAQKQILTGSSMTFLFPVYRLSGPMQTINATYAVTIVNRNCTDSTEITSSPVDDKRRLTEQYPFIPAIIGRATIKRAKYFVPSPGNR